MTDEERTPLSEQDIALLKEVVRWRRANDIGFFLTGSGKGFAGTHGYLEWTRWSDATDGGPRMRSYVVVEREQPDMVGESPPRRYGSFSWHRAESVTQAVDLLVAYGHLPPRFSSAYRAGWEAMGEFIGLTQPRFMSSEEQHRASAIQPAVEPTW